MFFFWKGFDCPPSFQLGIQKHKILKPKIFSNPRNFTKPNHRFLKKDLRLSTRQRQFSIEKKSKHKFLANFFFKSGNINFFQAYNRKKYKLQPDHKPGENVIRP